MIEWQVFASDTFDRESPATVDEKGHGLPEGFEALWRRSLTESVHDNGQATFTRFSLVWLGDSVDVGVQSFDNVALARIRTLVYGTPGPYEPGGAKDKAAVRACENRSLMQAIVRAHARLHEPRESSYSETSAAGRIRACAADPITVDELVARLDALT